MLPADSALFRPARATRAMDVAVPSLFSPSYKGDSLDEPHISPTSEEGGVRHGLFIRDREAFTIPRYDDDNDNDDDDDDDDEDEDENDNENENEKSIPGIRSYSLKDRRHVVVFLLKRPTDRPTDRPIDRSSSAAQCARSWLV
ncbi:hypothetical protein ACS0PU_010917 [Formica fusca]